MNPKRVVADDVESNAPTPVEEAAPFDSRLETISPGGEARQAFLKMMNDCKYARECVSTEDIMCKRFEDGLNEDIRLLVGILELKEFVVLVEKACKAEELAKEKEFTTRSNAAIGYSCKNWGKQYTVSKAQNTSIASVRNARPNRPECSQCGRCHPSECQGGDKTCFKCGSPNHFIRDCPERTERGNFQGTRSDSTANRGRSQKNPGSGTSSKGAHRESAVRPKGRALGRTYAIRAREEALSPDMITGTFSIYDTTVITLVDPGSTHLGHCFPANLMLLPFDKFDVILGMDWLTAHDVVVNC
ncbi:uncharacterized protein LOC128279903 [Gossypium arboreum]|uniref:uncharacterized protein LOC128279903 n=1 Tax=Gossypium arboreum TaxID=29729 RepID=UPI0022F1BAFE|nr:uncharacterized protein LOC128279903 [Gossypium arboreum]